MTISSNENEIEVAMGKDDPMTTTAQSEEQPDEDIPETNEQDPNEPVLKEQNSNSLGSTSSSSSSSGEQESSSVGVVKVEDQDNTVVDNNNNNNEDSINNTTQMSRRRKRRAIRVSLLSNVFFLLGSIFYMWTAMDDWFWAQESKEIPMEVLLADDDYTWVEFRKEYYGWNATATTSSSSGSSEPNDDQVRHLLDSEGSSSAIAEEEGDDDDDAGDDDEYGDTDWADLPLDVQQAYITLGYTEEIWDDGIGRASSAQYDWGELPPEHQSAAASLGYTEDSWNDDYVSVDDDVVFVVRRNISKPRHSLNTTGVSRYMILFFCAALCFVIVGTIDFVAEHNILHVFMILAGLFGLLSAMLVERNMRTSNIFNLISVHFFLLEGVTVLQSRRSMNSGLLRWLVHALAVADTFFLVGALLDVILGYLFLDDTAEFNTRIAFAECFSASLWLVTSIIYILASIILARRQLDLDDLVGLEETANNPKNMAVKEMDVEASDKDMEVGKA